MYINITFFYAQRNTFQGILVTDFVKSYAVFIYKCDDGFVTGDGLYVNHMASLNRSATTVACLNEPVTPWVNLVYKISSSGKHN